MNEFQFIARESDSISKCLVVLMFATTLISSWAIYASDTTLSGETVQVILRIVVYMCALACSFLLFLQACRRL